MAVHYCPACLNTFRETPARCPNLTCGRAQPKAGWGRLLDEGDLLDRHYRIERALAVGGAGLTYLAREVDADGQPQPPDLAIKVLYHARATGTFLTRLSTEAQILQEIAHDHIIQLRGFVHRSGTEPYLVTLFENGGTLTHHLEEHGALPVKIAADILIQVLSALNVAHQRGVVHRDLKPDNVLLREKVGRQEVPHIRVADFGIAKVAGSLTSHVTKMGTFVGTPEYAAPEQFDGMPPTPAADVFAAGALFIHMLTGELPVTFSNRQDIEACREDWMRVLPPALSPKDLVDADPVTAQVVLEVLRAMLAKRPEDRWTVQQVLKRLRGVAEGHVELQPVRETLELTAGPPPERKEAAPEPEVEPLISEGLRATLAGLGVLGAGALIAALIFTALGLFIAAWQWGYFTGDPVVVVGPTEPVVEPAPVPPVPVEPGPAPVGPMPVVPEPVEVPTPPQPAASPSALPLLDEEARMAAQRTLQTLAPEGCGTGAKLLTVGLEGGRVTGVEATDESLATCLLEAWKGAEVPGEGRARVALWL